MYEVPLHEAPFEDVSLEVLLGVFSQGTRELHEFLSMGYLSKLDAHV